MTVKLTINEIEVEVPEGITVLRAAEQAGIHIPTLCDHAHLTPYGGCRLCLVEVEGARTLQPSCTLPVSNGMVVRTNTPEVDKARKFVLTLLFSERNHFCMYCQMSGGDCELQNAAYCENMTQWLLQPNWTPHPVDASHPHFVLDHNRCILCRRCVRACAEMSGNFTLGVQERGADTILVADLNVPLGESTCIACGSCVQVCPTGALIDRLSAYKGHEADVETIKTTCAGCSVGCGVELVVRINGDWDAPVNEGVLCKMGRFLPLNEERARILTPLVRQNGALQAASWDEALSLVAKKLKPLIGQNGNNVAALASTRIPAEGLRQFKQLFAEGMGSEMVTSIEEGMTTALPGSMAQEIGQPFEGNLAALKTADCVVAIGVDLANSHQVAGFLVKRNLPNGTKLVSIDPFDNGLHELADYALRPREGQDLDLLRGLKAAVEQADASIEAVSKRTGIPAETIQAVGRLLATARNPVFVYGKGVTRAGSAKVMKVLLDLARAAGDNSSVLGIKGQANSLAAYQYGLDKLFEPDGRQAIYLALGDDHPGERLVQRLKGVPFLAVQASYASSITEMADVVLPTEMWAEQEGHFLNLEGRLQAIQPGLTPPADIWSHLKILEAIAKKLGLTLNGDWQVELKERISPNIILG
jgi:formate dehydrogenase major subunit